jgi:hypothetical protein
MMLVTREPIMWPISDSVSWQLDTLEIRALLAFMSKVTADLALLLRRLAGIRLHCAETFRSSLTDAINELVEVRMHQPPLQLDEVGNLLSISSAPMALTVLATIEAVDHHREEHLVPDGLLSYL